MYIDLIIRIMLISATGALSPGPLTMGAISLGSSKGWRSGLQMSIGHILVELPLVLLIAIGISHFPMESTMIGLSFLGGVTLMVIGLLQLRAVLKESDLPQDNKTLSSSPLILGVALSALNPSFIVWWLSIGSSLICEVIMLMDLIGVVLLYLSHFWIDIVWLSTVSYLSNLGYRRISKYRYFIASIDILMIVLGIDMVYRGVGFLLECFFCTTP